MVGGASGGGPYLKEKRYTGVDVLRFFAENIAKGRRHYDIKGRYLHNLRDILEAIIWGGRLKTIEEPDAANDNRSPGAGDAA